MLFEFFEVLFWFVLPLIAMVMSNLASKDPDLFGKLPQVPRSFFNRKCIESLNYFKTQCRDLEPQPTTSWWLNQPIWKIWSSDWIISPKIGVKIRNVWVAITNQHNILERLFQSFDWIQMTAIKLAFSMFLPSSIFHLKVEGYPLPRSGSTRYPAFHGTLDFTLNKTHQTPASSGSASAAWSRKRNPPKKKVKLRDSHRVHWGKNLPWKRWNLS